jgi:hypothetical protein
MISQGCSRKRQERRLSDGAEITTQAPRLPLQILHTRKASARHVQKTEWWSKPAEVLPFLIERLSDRARLSGNPDLYSLHKGGLARRSRSILNLLANVAGIDACPDRGGPHLGSFEGIRLLAQHIVICWQAKPAGRRWIWDMRGRSSGRNMSERWPPRPCRYATPDRVREYRKRLIETAGKKGLLSWMHRPALTMPA